MAFPQISLLRLALAAGLACPSFAVAQVQRIEARGYSPSEAPQFRTRTATSAVAAKTIPLDTLPAAVRDRVRTTINKPTLVTHANPEEFRADAKMYEWLLEHPDRAAAAWQRLGVACSPITDRGQGRFGWADDHGSDVTWSIVARGPQYRVWYAEGQVKAGPLTPSVPVRAVVVIRHDLPATPDGKIRHQADIFCHADSRAANMVYRLFGRETDRMAEQAAEQMLMFFSSLSQHVAKHPDAAERLLAPATARGASKK